MLTVYKIIINMAYAIMQPYFALKRRKAPEEWDQRRVINPEKYLPYSTNPNTGQREGGPRLHFHASSVGEVRVLERLVKAVKAIRPEMRYCISTYTRTGQNLARDQFPDSESVFFFPIDSHRPLKRFFNHYHPDGIIMVETEIWPYFLDFCRKNGIPLALANGRLTAKSTRYYRIFSSTLRPLLAGYKKLIMQTDDDAKRMIEIGADPERIIALGNIKHDLNSDIDSAAMRNETRRMLNLSNDQLLYVAASTRPGEEEIICRAVHRVSAFPKKMKLLLAPRHLERLDEVAGILKAAGIEYTMYSQLESGKRSDTPAILMDKMGLLAGIFYGADLSFVGGTLADLGGHNILEPVLAGSPVLFGPSIYNVKEAAENVIDKKQGMLVQDADQMAGAIQDFADGSLTFRKIDSSGPSVAEQTAAIIVKELGL